jgi:lysophospholipase L1-like esterase
MASGSINTMQFRYSRELEMPKPAHVCRIFLIGGSTAYGSGASSNERTIGGYLEKYLNEQADQYGCRFEVVTAGSSGWATTNERILIENRLVELQPDMVLAFSGHNDAFWGLYGRNVEWFRGFQEMYYLTLLNAFLGHEYGETFPLNLTGEREQVPASLTCSRLRRNVELSHAALQTVGADYCFALQPIMACSKKVRTPREEKMAHRPGNFPVLTDEAGFVDRYNQMRDTLKALERPHYHFLDLTDLFDSYDGQTEIFLDRCHFGDRGYDLIACRLRELLRPILQERHKRSNP